MLDYVFFDPAARVRFLEFLAQHDIAAQCTEEPDDESYSVLIDEDIIDRVGDELADAIDEVYDRLMIEQANAVEVAEGYAVNLVGVQYTRPDGQVGVVRLEPSMMNQITACLTVEALQGFVQHIADEVAAAHIDSMCKVLGKGMPTE